MKNYIQVGRVMDVTAPSGGYVSSQAVAVGDVLGVASIDAAEGENCTVSIDGVYSLPKTTGAISQGVKLYWDPAGDPVGGTAGSGALTATAGALKVVGIAFNAAASGDATVNIRLN